MESWQTENICQSGFPLAWKASAYAASMFDCARMGSDRSLPCSCSGPLRSVQRGYRHRVCRSGSMSSRQSSGRPGSQASGRLGTSSSSTRASRAGTSAGRSEDDQSKYWAGRPGISSADTEGLVFSTRPQTSAGIHSPYLSNDISEIRCSSAVDVRTPSQESEPVMSQENVERRLLDVHVVAARNLSTVHGVHSGGSDPYVKVRLDSPSGSQSYACGSQSGHRMLCRQSKDIVFELSSGKMLMHLVAEFCLALRLHISVYHHPQQSLLKIQFSSAIQSSRKVNPECI